MLRRTTSLCLGWPNIKGTAYMRSATGGYWVGKLMGPRGTRASLIMMLEFTNQAYCRWNVSKNFNHEIYTFLGIRFNPLSTL